MNSYNNLLISSIILLISIILISISIGIYK